MLWIFGAIMFQCTRNLVKLLESIWPFRSRTKTANALVLCAEISFPRKGPVHWEKARKGLLISSKTWSSCNCYKLIAMIKCDHNTCFCYVTSIFKYLLRTEPKLIIDILPRTEPSFKNHEPPTPSILFTAYWGMNNWLGEITDKTRDVFAIENSAIRYD